MAAIPKVKVTFDADLDGLKRGTSQASGEIEGFGGKIEKFGKMAAGAFAAAAAAAGAYAIKIGIDGVKAAIEDEAAQSRLAETLKNAAGATDEVIDSTEKFISKMQLATGVSDTKLRDAMGRLTLSTNDVTKSQELLTLALDISKAKNIDVETVANALGKAYDGQNTALGKLGVGFSTAELKGKPFVEIQGKLNDLFSGAAAKNAETYQGRIDRLKQAFEEAKETIGNALLPILDRLMQFVTTYVLPVFQKLSDAFDKNKDGLNAKFQQTVDFVKGFLLPIFDAFRNAFDKVKNTIMDNKDAIMDWLNNYKDIYAWAKEYILPFIQKILVNAIEDLSTKISIALKVIIPVVKFISDQVKNLINGVIMQINMFIDAYNFVNGLWGGQDVKKIKLVGAQEIYTGNPNLKTNTSASLGGTSSGGGSILANTPKITIPTNTPTITSSTGKISSTLPGVSGSASQFGANTPSAMAFSGVNTTTLAGIAAASGITINVNAPSVIDQQGFSNAVVDALNNATYRGTRLPIA